ILADGFFEQAIGNTGFGRLRAIGDGEAAPVLEHLEAAESAIGVADHEIEHPALRRALDHAIALEVRRAAQRAFDRVVSSGRRLSLRLTLHRAGGEYRAHAEKQHGERRVHQRRLSCETSRTAPRAALVAIAA